MCVCFLQHLHAIGSRGIVHESCILGSQSLHMIRSLNHTARQICIYRKLMKVVQCCYAFEYVCAYIRTLQSLKPHRVDVIEAHATLHIELE